MTRASLERNETFVSFASTDVLALKISMRIGTHPR